MNHAYIPLRNAYVSVIGARIDQQTIEGYIFLQLVRYDWQLLKFANYFDNSKYLH